MQNEKWQKPAVATEWENSVPRSALDKPPLISVVVPTRHRLDLLANCLELLSPQRQRISNDQYEVIVTDDGINPSAEALVGSRFPWVRWIGGPLRGPAANRNNGATSARGSWLIFTDDDCLPCDGYVSQYFAAIQTKEALVWEGKTVAVGERNRQDMECPINESGGFLWSCNFCIQRDLFFRLGGFDEQFLGACMEDVDLRTRLLKRGERILFLPGAEVGHGWRPQRGLKFIRLHAVSTGYYLSKHPEEWKKFGWSNRVLGMLRRTYRKLRGSINDRCFQGLGRFLILEIYDFLYVTKVLFSASERRIKTHQSN